MRYQNIQSVDFTNVRGETRRLKDLRPLVSYEDIFEIKNTGEFIDFVAVRAYGDESEPLYYKIADQNIKEIVSRKFDLMKIKIFKVPII